MKRFFVRPLASVIAGVDEAGRGSLVGAVVTAAVILDFKKNPILGLSDSKKLTEKRRKELYSNITECAVAWSIGRAEASEIDNINIHQATLLGMRRAILNLAVVPDLVLVDGCFYPTLPMPAQALVKGDSYIAEISAASIIAKVTRDQEMNILDLKLPEYGFACHKGYATSLHLEKLVLYGATEHHRKSFAPVRRILSKE